MIMYLLSYFSAFLIGMLVMGIFWYNSWEDIKIKEESRSAQLYQEKMHCYDQLAQIDRLIDDLGSEEMRRQYQKIIKW